VRVFNLFSSKHCNSSDRSQSLCHRLSRDVAARRASLGSLLASHGLVEAELWQDDDDGCCGGGEDGVGVRKGLLRPSSRRGGDAPWRSSSSPRARSTASSSSGVAPLLLFLRGARSGLCSLQNLTIDDTADPRDWISSWRTWKG
jgi:hypothetical protein